MMSNPTKYTPDQATRVFRVIADALPGVVAAAEQMLREASMWPEDNTKGAYDDE